MSLTDEQLSRLPKYAQDEIRVLRMRVAEYKAQAFLVVEKTPTPVIVEPYRRHTEGVEPTYLPARATVRFELPGVQRWIDVRLKDGKAQLMASSTLVLEMHSSNLAYVSTTR